MTKITSRNRISRNSLSFESLERRETPAQFGLPWVDPMHLTTSFAPENTPAASEASNLQSALDSQLGRAAWQFAILKAMQTWSEAAGVNIGVTSDSGVEFGAAGKLQGDARFGDIRVGGFRMSPDVLAISSPPSSGIAGTIAGDIFVNTKATFTQKTLLAAALHEVGHTLGLPNSTNPRSVMYGQIHTNLSLAPEDVSAVRALYGARPADLNEGQKTNDSFKEATRIRFPSDTVYTGATPLVQYGDITTPADTDIFYMPKLSGYSGPVTFRLQTEGVSLLQPKMTIYDASGKNLGQVTSAKIGGDVLQFTVPRYASTYYVKVEAAPGSDFRVGRYSLAATFDGRLQPTTIGLTDVMRGAYEGLNAYKVDELFRGASQFEFENDLHTDDDVAFAVNLTPTVSLANGQKFSVAGTLTDATDIDYYRLRSPSTSGNTPWVLTVTINSAAVNGIVPEIVMSDSSLTPVKSQVIARNAQTLTIQATGIAPNASLFLRVSGSTGGNYLADANFGRVATTLATIASAELTTATPNANYKLYVAESQVFGLTLSSVGGPVEMTIKNSSGATVFTLATPANSFWSGFTPILPPGEYSVTFRSLDPTQKTQFLLRGDSLTDPIGPVIDSSTLLPQYRSPLNPNLFLYPEGTTSSDPSLWLLIGLA